MALDKIEFFGAVDKKGKHADGKVTSEYPAWYLDTHIQELQEEINKYENSIKNNLIPEKEMPRSREEVKRLKERMTLIIKSKPKITGKDLDTLNGIYKDLTGQIGDSMFTYTEMQKGLVSAHEEARRMINPIISVNSECASILPQLGIKPQDGKISRNQAGKVIKIIGRLLGERTDTEYFRKDQAYGTYRGGRSLAELEAGA